MDEVFQLLDYLGINRRVRSRPMHGWRIGGI